jgi:defect in organelle trafficking protein DotC
MQKTNMLRFPRKTLTVFKRLGVLFFCCSALLSLTACESHHFKLRDDDPSPTNRLEALQNLNAGRIDTEKKNNGIRLQALRQTALSLAAQEALALRSEQINELLVEKGRALDHIYNFNQLMLSHNVVPPVLATADNTLKITGDDMIRLSDRTYEVVTQAHFVTAAPTWRDYLSIQYPRPDAPHPSLLPKDREEQKYWREYIVQGWQLGLDQAGKNFSNNLGRLIRDYNGMILYRKLNNQGIVSAPFVARTDLGITGGGNNLRIHDQVLRITAISQLKSEGQVWQPALITEKTPTN